MKAKNILKSVSIAACVLSLAACSSMSGNSGYGNNGDNGGAYSMGLGNQGGIQGTNTSNPNRLKAPYNQTYHFGFDKSIVQYGDNASIDAQANYLISHDSARVLLAGNTDIRGSREYNIALGERRAQAVANRLKLDGVNQDQIRLISYGAEKPVAFGNDEDAYAKNRRVDLTYEAK